MLIIIFLNKLPHHFRFRVYKNSENFFWPGKNSKFRQRCDIYKKRYYMNRQDIIKKILQEGTDDYLTRIAHLSPAEQQKIKDTISSIDHVIELQTQKLELLKQHRKGLLQKIIPNTNKSITPLRFPEFNNQ